MALLEIAESLLKRLLHSLYGSSIVTVLYSSPDHYQDLHLMQFCSTVASILQYPVLSRVKKKVALLLSLYTTTSN